MFDPKDLPILRQAIRNRALADKVILEDLRSEVRELKPEVRPIKPRSTTAVSLVASDGGNNQLVFDPFHVQLVRVVDSYGKQLFLDTISPTTDPDQLCAAQFNDDGTPKSALGRMMFDLAIEPRSLHGLSPMIPESWKVREKPEEVSPSWVLVYRDLCEWAVLYERICHTTFATDTLIVRDGPLRSKLFAKEYFIEYRRRVEKAIQETYDKDRRRIFLVGISKHSKVLMRYNLAMAVENVLPAGEARYVRIPRTMEAKAYVWPEYARGAESEGIGEAPKFVAGDMFFVRFGHHSGDPVWTVDILSTQSDKAGEIFGYLLADAIDGFPVPFYPRCLQKAHEYAQIVDFDLDVLQDEILAAVRGLLTIDEQPILDAMQLRTDVAGRRYQ
jgi:hypothetical protein